MRLVLGRDAMVAEWVGHHLPLLGSNGFGPCSAIGVESDSGEPLGGVVFSNWKPRYRSVELSGAAVSRRWLTRPIICGIAAYPFVQLGCQRISALTAKRNKASRAFLEAFGFKREGVIRKGAGDDDTVFYGLLKREWDASRWARPRNSAKS